jgi:hypothetical protein
VITRPLSWSESRTGRVMQTFSPQTGNFAHFYTKFPGLLWKILAHFFFRINSSILPDDPGDIISAFS